MTATLVPMVVWTAPLCQMEEPKRWDVIRHDTILVSEPGTCERWCAPCNNSFSPCWQSCPHTLTPIATQAGATHDYCLLSMEGGAYRCALRLGHEGKCRPNAIANRCSTQEAA